MNIYLKEITCNTLSSTKKIKMIGLVFEIDNTTHILIIKKLDKGEVYTLNENQERIPVKIGTIVKVKRRYDMVIRNVKENHNISEETINFWKSFIKLKQI